MGGKTTSGSGNRWFAKNDVVTKEWSIENKRTDKKQYVLKVEEVLKARLNALRSGKDYVFQVEFGAVKLAVVDWDVWLRMGELNDVEIGDKESNRGGGEAPGR